MDVNKFLSGVFDGKNDNPDPTIQSHYGIKDDEFELMVKNCLISFIKHNKKSDTLDEQFKNVDASTRAKIFAYAIAFEKYEKLQGRD